MNKVEEYLSQNTFPD